MRNSQTRKEMALTESKAVGQLLSEIASNQGIDSEARLLKVIYPDLKNQLSGSLAWPDDLAQFLSLADQLIQGEKLTDDDHLFLIRSAKSLLAFLSGISNSNKPSA